MKRLTHRETRSLLSSVTVLHADLREETLPARIFAAIRQIIPTDITGLDWLHPEGWWLQKSWQDPEGSVTAEAMQVFNRHASEHPLFREFLRTGLAEPRKTTDFVTTQEFRRLGIYNEFYRRLGVDQQMITGLSISPNLIVGIALNRSARDFTESERSLLTQLRPHLLTACLNSEALSRVRLHLDQLEAAIEESGRGVIILTPEGRVQLMTKHARELLNKYFTTRRGQTQELPEQLAAWARQRAADSWSEEPAGTHAPELEVPGAASRLKVRLLEERAARRQALLLEEERTLPHTALESLGLTRREAEVLGQVAQGRPNAEVAGQCGMSVRTVQKHLENIFRKLGVESRTAAVRKALEAVKNLS